MILPAAFSIRDAIAATVQIINLLALWSPTPIRFQWSDGEHDMGVGIAVTFVMKRKISAHSICHKVVLDIGTDKG